MTRSFNKVIVVGQPLSAGSPSDILLPAHQQCPDVVFHDFDTSAVGVSQFLRASGQTVCALEEVGDWGAWAPAGQVTTVVAPHLSMPRQLFDPAMPAHQFGAGLGILGELAGWPRPQQLELFALERLCFNAEVARLCDAVRQRLQGRALRVLTLTERPLLGADSVLVADPDALPVRGLSAEDLQRVTAFYQAVKEYLLQNSLLPAAGGDERDWNPSRADGSGAGYGLAALAPVLFGFRGRALDVFSQTAELPTLITPDTLLVATLPALHPQTVANSSVALLKELSETVGVPLIVFAEESSLSKHELYEWNVSACYTPNWQCRSAAEQRDYYLRVLTQTWLRPR